MIVELNNLSFYAWQFMSNCQNPQLDSFTLFYEDYYYLKFPNGEYKFVRDGDWILSRNEKYSIIPKDIFVELFYTEQNEEEQEADSIISFQKISF